MNTQKITKRHSRNEHVTDQSGIFAILTQKYYLHEKASDLELLPVLNVIRNNMLTLESTFLIYEYLKTGVIDPSILLEEILNSPYVKGVSLIIIWCLRFGASPNLYYKSNKIHIVVNLMATNYDFAVKRSIFDLLLAYGTNIESPIFPGVIQESVKDYIFRMYNIVLNPNLETKLTPEKYTTLMILSDNDKFIPKEINFDQIRYAITYRSNNILPVLLRIAKLQNINILLPKGYLLISAAINYNKYALIEICNINKIVPSYQIVNSILGRLMNKNPIISSICEEMILYCVHMGVIFDSEQYKIILGSRMLESFNSTYNIPRYIKISRRYNDSQVYEYAINLNISGKNLCEQLLENKFPTTIAGRKEEVDKHIAELPGLPDSPGVSPVKPIGNEKENYDYYEYPNVAIIFFVEENRVYFITAPQYVEVYKSGKNPYTNNSLNNVILEEIFNKIKFFLNLPIQLLKYSEALNLYLTPDKIDNSQSELKLTILYKDALINGVSMDVINRTSKSVYEYIFSFMNYNITFPYENNKLMLYDIAYFVYDLPAEEKKSFFDNLLVSS